jgi:hypothetical protein
VNCRLHDLRHFMVTQLVAGGVDWRTVSGRAGHADGHMTLATYAHFQQAQEHAGCALLVVTHWNKTGDGRGADRISGAGPAAWARVICSVSVGHRQAAHIDDDGASTVLLGVEVIGGEVADTHFRIRRRVRADDPADLGAPLAYSVEILAGDDDDLDPAAAALSKSRQWVLTALRAGGDLQTVKQLGDRLAQAGHPLKLRTIQTALGELEVAGLAQGSEEGNGRARYWSPAIANLDADNAGDGQPGDGGGEGMA